MSPAYAPSGRHNPGRFVTELSSEDREVEHLDDLDRCPFCGWFRWEHEVRPEWCDWFIGGDE